MFSSSNEVTKFSGYNARTPQDIRVFFNEELRLRDFGGFYIGPDGQPSKRQIGIVGLQPFSKPITNFDEIIGYFPVISIWQSSKRYSSLQTHAYGYRKAISIDQAFIDSIKTNLPIGKREEFMILSDKQLDLIQSAVTRHGSAYAELKGKWKEEIVKVQIWSHEEEEDANLIADFTDGIIQDLAEIAGPRLKNFNVSEEWGNVNFTYGRPLFGIEKNLTFINYYWTITVYDEAGGGAINWGEACSNSNYKSSMEVIFDPDTRVVLSGVRPAILD